MGLGMTGESHINDKLLFTQLDIVVHPSYKEFPHDKNYNNKHPTTKYPQKLPFSHS